MSAIPLPRDTQLDSPAEVLRLLSGIERDLANRQNSYESAARDWYTAQRGIRKEYATALLRSSETSVTAQKAEADLAALACEGSEHEAEYEALKAVIRVLDQRSMILMAILKSQGRMA